MGEPIGSTEASRKLALLRCRVDSRRIVSKFRGTAPALEIPVTTPAGVPVEADKIRCALADGQAVVLRFDGWATYAAEFKPTLCEDDQPEASGDRLLTEFSTAISGLKLTSAQEDFQKAASGYVDERQRARYARIMAILTAETNAAVVVFRLVKASGEYAEPAREGDVIVAWTPNIAESHRDLKERKAVAVPVVNDIKDALLHSHVLAPFSLRVDASTAVDAPSEPLCYDDVYRKIFQVARVAQGSPPGRELQKELQKERDRRDSKWRDQRVSWWLPMQQLPKDLSATCKEPVPEKEQEEVAEPVKEAVPEPAAEVAVPEPVAEVAVPEPAAVDAVPEPAAEVAVPEPAAEAV